MQRGIRREGGRPRSRKVSHLFSSSSDNDVQELGLVLAALKSALNEKQHHSRRRRRFDAIDPCGITLQLSPKLFRDFCSPGDLCNDFLLPSLGIPLDSPRSRTGLLLDPFSAAASAAPLPPS